MVVRRREFLASMSLAALTGCHAGTSGNLAKSPPPITRENLSATRFIAQHNKNAATIQSIQAQPGIAVAGRGGRQYRVGGRLALERPQDFRLQLTMPGGGKSVADIGSNDRGFWFWVDEDKAEKQIFVCDHDQVGASPLAVTLQPEWIVEALGLREFSPEEARTINVKTEGRPGLLLLTQMRKDAKGQALTKEYVIDEASNQILEHRLWSGAKKELLASAVISEYQTKELSPPAARDADPTDEPAKIQVTLPKQFRLTWTKENFKLDVNMTNARINPKFPDNQRADLFTEPKLAGVQRVDLAKLGEPAGRAPGASSRMYESMPRPRSGGIRLGQPEAPTVGVEGAYRRPGNPGPSPLAADIAPLRADGRVAVVGAPIPRGSDLDALRASALAPSSPLIFNR